MHGQANVHLSGVVANGPQIDCEIRKSGKKAFHFPDPNEHILLTSNANKI